VQRLLDNVAELQKLPGARLLRVGEEKVSLGEIQALWGRPAVQDRDPAVGHFFRNGPLQRTAAGGIVHRGSVIPARLAGKTGPWADQSLQDAMVSYWRPQAGSRSGSQAAPASKRCFPSPNRLVVLRSKCSTSPTRSRSQFPVRGSQVIRSPLLETDGHQEAAGNLCQDDGCYQATRPVRMTPNDRYCRSGRTSRIPVLLDQLKSTLNDLQLFHQEISSASCSRRWCYTVVAALAQGANQCADHVSSI